MKINASLRHALLAALPVLLFAALPILLLGQAAGSHSQLNPHDLNPQMDLFNNYESDFGKVVMASPGTQEADTAGLLSEAALDTERSYYAMNVMLQMYDNISNEPDRVRVRFILKKSLAFYSLLIATKANDINGTLTFARTPIVVQEALRMKDDLRTAKERLDALASSLDNQ